MSGSDVLVFKLLEMVAQLQGLHLLFILYLDFAEITSVKLTPINIPLSNIIKHFHCHLKMLSAAILGFDHN